MSSSVYSTISHLISQIEILPTEPNLSNPKNKVEGNVIVVDEVTSVPEVIELEVYCPSIINLLEWPGAGWVL